MGKEKRKRGATPRGGPLPPRKNPQDTDQPGKASMDSIKQQLQMPNLEEKLCGLQAIGTYLESEEHVKLLVDNGIVRIVFPLLVDENSQVRNTTAGTLRNFSTLNLDACEYLIEQDIMTPLIAFFKKYAEDWIPKQVKGHLDEDGDTFLQSVYLLWNLCESSGTSIKYVNDSHILPILVRCLNREVFGDEMVIAISHCLFVVIEDNPNAVLEIKELCEKPLNDLLSVSDSTPFDTLLKTLAVGITLNMRYPNILSAPQDFVQNVMQILTTTMSIDIRNSCHKVSSILPLDSDDEEEDVAKSIVEVRKEIERLKSLIDAQQTAIEIITNICSPEEETMDVDETSDVDSDMEDENITCNGTEALYVTNKLSPEVTQLIVQSNFMEKVWEKTSSLADNVTQLLNESELGKHLLHRYYMVQSRALLCTNNFIENLPIENLGGHQALYRVWVDTGKLVFKSAYNADNVDVLESATAVMRAALDKLKSDVESKGVVIDLFKNISINDLTEVLTGITQCEYSEIRVNLIRMLGNLVLILISMSSEQPAETEVLISEFLLDRIFKESECWTLAELLDTLMDVFAEDETDKLALRINLVGKLSEIAPIIKTKVRQQRKTLGDHSAVVSTVTGNLPRFIKYKRKRIELLNK